MAHSMPSRMYSSCTITMTMTMTITIACITTHLFQHKHVVVEELLKLLVAKVDGQLLEPVEVKDLKPSNVQNT